MKFPIGIQSFEKIREDGYIYIDKTNLIYDLTHEGSIYFLSRPRRFGKSLLVSTLECYFQGKKELFEGLAIEKLETEWNQYPIFHIDFNPTDFTTIGKLESTIDEYLTDWEKQYGITEQAPDLGLRFSKIIKAAYAQTGKQAVVLIDEYDKPLLDVMDTGYTLQYQGITITLEERNRNILKAFYSTFKHVDEALQFVLLTGVTKFSQVSVFSGFNQPKDISMTEHYDTLCGITEEEMNGYFKKEIAKMAVEYDCTPDEMKEKLKKHYDGYHFSKRLKGVANPFSLLNSLQDKDLQDYWFRTGTPTYLIRLLSHFNENLNELTGRYYLPKQFVDYKADVEQPLPMIYQSGYLTIKDYKRSMNTFLLDFPNDEVKSGFISLVAANYLKPKKNVDSWVISAAEALEDGRLEDFHQQLTSFLSSIPYEMRRKENEREKERYFHYTFYLLLRLTSSFILYTEKQNSQGRADCVFETDLYIYIFEFKLDGTAQEALQQIEDKQYALPYATDKRQLFKIGASFSSVTGTIADWDVEPKDK